MTTFAGSVEEAAAARPAVAPPPAIDHTGRGHRAGGIHGAAHATRMAPVDARRPGRCRRRRPAGNGGRGGGIPGTTGRDGPGRSARGGRVPLRRRPHRPPELQLPGHDPRRGDRGDAAARDHELRAVGAARRAARAAAGGEPGTAAALADDRPARLLRGDRRPLRGRRHRAERLQPQLQGPLLGRRDRPRLRDGGGARGPGHHGVCPDEQRPAHRPLRRPLRHAGRDAQPFPHRSERVRYAR